ncbi:MAG: HEAT repeat domain-containing protein [Nitrospirota bacterium]
MKYEDNIYTVIGIALFAGIFFFLYNFAGKGCSHSNCSELKECVDQLKSNSAQKRACAAYNLGKMEEKPLDAVPMLIDMLNDVQSVRIKRGFDRYYSLSSPAYEAITALGEIKDRRAVEPLIQHLAGSSQSLKLAIIWTLKDIRDDRAIGPLIDSLTKKDDDITREASRALKEITNEDFGEDHSKWQEWWSQQGSQ